MIYPARYQSEPGKRKAYCYACDLIVIYGLGYRYFNPPGISPEEKREIWNIAMKDMKGKSFYCIAA